MKKAGEEDFGGDVQEEGEEGRGASPLLGAEVGE